MGDTLKWYVVPAALFLVALWVLAFSGLHRYRRWIAGRQTSGGAVTAGRDTSRQEDRG